MNIESQIQALENLAKLDEELVTVEKKLDAERSTLGDKRKKLVELEQRLNGGKASLEEMEKTRNELVGEARQMSGQMDRSREKFSRCRTEREVNAAQREMEELRRLYRDRELEIQKLTELAEQAQTDIADVEKRHAEVLEELGETAGAAETQVQGLESQVGDCARRRAELSAAVPPALFRRYEMIRKRRGTGIAHTSNGTCCACHIALAPMMFQQLRRAQKLDSCPACNRIIYFKPAPPPEEEAGEAED